MPVSDEVANSYYQRLRVLQGASCAGNALHQRGRRCGAGRHTQGFGVANYYRMNGQEEKGVEMLKKGRVHGGTQQVVRGVRLPGQRVLT